MDSIGSYNDSSFSEPKGENSIHSGYETDSIICNRYRVLEKKSGGMGHGTIFYCLDLWDRTACVLKEIPARYYNEARLFAKIPFHPNIVELRRLEVVGGSVLMVQEWLPNDLSKYLNSGMSGEQIENIIQSVCRGLNHCIRFLSPSNITYYHGDIKPENIFIGTDGTIKLGDFGGGHTTGYKSPEQGNHGVVDFRTDIYSIGCVIKELKKYCTDEAYKKKLDILAEKCICPSPEDRIQSVQEIYKELCGSEIEESTVWELTPSQLNNLSLIGEPVNLYQLANKTGRATDDELCDIAEILLRNNLPHQAIEVYGRIRFFNKNYRASAGLAKAYQSLSDWDHAIFASREAIEMVPTDYRSIYVHINSLFNKAAKEVNIEDLGSTDAGQHKGKKAFIDFSPNGQIIREAFNCVITGLKTIHEKFPTHQEPLRLLGYVYSILGDQENVILYYREYLSTSKDDYESAYYYAMALYLSNDISNARKQFQMVADFIENSESRSLNRAIMLLYCKYFLDDSEGFNDAFLYVEDMVDLLTEEEKKKLEGQLTKVALINDCFIKDEDYARPYHYKLAEIGREIRSGNGTDKEWCQEQLERIAKYRDEWSRLPYSDISISIRQLNFLSYDYETYFYEILGDDEAALSACDNMLGYDHSSANALYNKAVALCRLERYIESIPLYREAFRCQSDQKKRNTIKQEEKGILFYIYQNPDEFYNMLLGKAPTWYGSRPTELESLIQDYSLLFTESILEWFSEYAESLADDLLQHRCRFEAAFPLMNLLEALHDAIIPEFSEEEDPLSIEMTVTPSVVKIYHFSRPTNLAEVSLQVLNILVKAAEKSDVPFFLFNCLRLHGEAYYDRKYGDKDENLEIARLDFQRILKMPESILPNALPHVAWAAHYLGKIHIDRQRGTNNLANAHTYLDFASSIYQSAGNSLNEARVLVSQAICFFKESNLPKATTSAAKALEKVTVDEDKATFAKAEYIIGTTSVFLTLRGNKHFKEVLREGVEAFENALLFFKEETVEWAFCMRNLAFLYQSQEKHFHDGSWALEKYYRKKLLENGHAKYEMKDSLGQSATACVVDNL